MSTSLSKPYTHLVADFYKGADERGPYYLVQYLFEDWADSDQIVNEMIGLSYRVGTTTVRNPPHQHPLSPNLYCQSARVVPASKPTLNANGLPSFSGGFVVEAEYRPSLPQGTISLADDPGLNHQIDPTTPILWCTQELDFDSEVMVLGNHSYKWVTGGTSANIPLKVEVAVTTMVLTFHRLPLLPTPLFRTLKGRVNNAPFLGAATGKVRFVGGRTVREATTDGSVAQKCTLVFKEREVEWNKFFRPDTMGWDYVTDATTTNRVYAEANLLPLIQL